MEVGMKLRAVLPLLFVASMAGCASNEWVWPGPRAGTGWSGAPDLSVYGAMDMAGELAREQEVLCLGRNPAAVADRWRYEFAAREDWIRAALTQRYGATAVAGEAARVAGREPCPEVMDER